MQYIERELAPDTKIPIRIGFIKPNGAPSIISLWYIDIDGKIYCATQKSAKIIHYLKNQQKIDLFGNPPIFGLFLHEYKDQLSLWKK